MLEIKTIRSKLEGMNDFERQQAWEYLYEEKVEGAKEELNRICKAQDPILKILFLRFLTQIPQAKSLEYIIELLNTENPIVFKCAQDAFEKSDYRFKHHYLLKLCFSQNQAQFFAFEKLAFKRKYGNFAHFVSAHC